MSDINVQDDPRLGLPSASEFERIAECAGYPQLKAVLTMEFAKIIELPDENAEKGIRIHKARETGDTSNLEPDELEIYNQGMMNEEQIVNQWATDLNLDVSRIKPGKVEERLWLNHPETFDPLCSGQLDVHDFCLPHILIIDWKSLWSPHLKPAYSNWQGRLQSVLAWKNYDDVQHIRFALNRAMFRKGIDWVDYWQSDLEHSEQAILYRLWESQQPDAPRRPGQHCNYCPCKPWCPEAGAYALLPSVIVNPLQAVATLAPVDLVKLWQSKGIITKILDKVTDRLKAMPEAELAALGLAKGKPRNLDPITDTKEACNFLETQGFNDAELWSLLKLGKTELSAKVREKKQLTKEATAKWIADNLEPFITKQPSEAPLEELGTA